MRKILVVAATALAVATIWPAAPASASRRDVLTCGMTVTTSVTLESDLSCAGDALIVGADAITIELAGHTISGDGTGAAIRSNAHGNLIVNNGTISGFERGIDLFNLQFATFTSLTIRDGEALHLDRVTDMTFQSGTLQDTTARVTTHSDRAGFEHLTARNATVSLRESNDAHVTQSQFTDSLLDGFESDRANVANNVLLRSPITYRVTSRNWTIQSNTILNADNGVNVLVTSPDGHILNNVFIGNQVGVRVDVNFLDEIDGTVISGNTFLGNGAAGILFDGRNLSATPSIEISKNRALLNGFHPGGRTDHLGRPVEDGVHIASIPGSPVTVAANTTTHNHSYGIFADPGTVIDGGGNKSIADPLGCLGVVCA